MIKIKNESFENVSVEIFGNDRTNQNLFQEEIKRLLESGNA
jgi:hypothetical protein